MPLKELAFFADVKRKVVNHTAFFADVKRKVVKHTDMYTITAPKVRVILHKSVPIYCV